MINIRSENGAIATVVLVSMLIFLTVLAGSYMINANVKKAQLKSQILLRDEYAETLSEDYKLNVYCEMMGFNVDDFKYEE